MKTKNPWIHPIAIIGLLLTFTLGCEKEDPPTLTTLPVTEITSNSAKSGGNITDDGGATVTARGVVWSTSENPTVDNNDGKTTDGTGSGQFTSNITELSAGTTYYVRAYAINNEGTSYGDQKEFTTEGGLATVITAEIIDITSTSAISGGNITHDGGVAVTARGVVWSTSENPTLEDNDGFTEDGEGTGEYTSQLTDLSPGTTYYVQAYATNSEGTAYGDEVEFATIGAAPTATTNDASDITSTSAILNGSVNPNQLSTVVSFEYGITTDYGNEVEAEQSPVSGSENVVVSAEVLNYYQGQYTISG